MPKIEHGIMRKCSVQDYNGEMSFIDFLNTGYKEEGKPHPTWWLHYNETYEELYIVGVSKKA